MVYSLPVRVHLPSSEGEVSGGSRGFCGFASKAPFLVAALEANERGLGNKSLLYHLLLYLALRE